MLTKRNSRSSRARAECRRRFHVLFQTDSSGQEILALLNCRRLPARLSTGETAVVLGFQEHDIAPLIAAKLLAPLGKPASNAPKYFATVDVLAAAQDRDWLSQATRALARHWRIKNSRKKSGSLFDAAA